MLPGGHDGPFILFGVLSYISDVLESSYLYGLKKGFVIAIPVFSMAATSYLSGALLSERKALWKWVVVGGMTLSAAALTLLPLFAALYLPWPSSLSWE